MKPLYWPKYLEHLDFKVDYGGEILRFTVLFLKKNEAVLVFSGIVIFHIQNNKAISDKFSNK